MDISEDLFKEILLYMRVQLKSDANFITSIRVINTILTNIVHDMNNVKFQKLRLSNEKIKKSIADSE
jgi:hypothetical protein